MIDVLPLFPDLNESLITFLNNLKPADWHRKTVCNQWNVRDIAAHLLDTSIKKLSLSRDRFIIDDKQKLGNKDWVKTIKGISPIILTEMISIYQNQLLAYFKQLKPTDQALLGESISEISKAYQERWLHQQQIRYAFNDQFLLQPKFYSPFLEIFMLALPVKYSKIEAPSATVVEVKIAGPAGKSWYIKKQSNSWVFSNNDHQKPSASVYIDQQIAWLLFSKGILLNEAAQYYHINGDKNLGQHALSMLTVIA